MAKHKNGFIYYECLIAFMVSIMLITTLIGPLPHLLQKMANQKLTDQMNHILALNVVLIERGESLMNDSTYLLMKEDDRLCIIWNDKFNESRKKCEKIWL